MRKINLTAVCTATPRTVYARKIWQIGYEDLEVRVGLDEVKDTNGEPIHPSYRCLFPLSLWSLNRARGRPTFKNICLPPRFPHLERVGLMLGEVLESRSRISWYDRCQCQAV